ncbi:MAG: hypothetical protein EPO35_12340 [Acidobacteria bacterium]|nr:MAG: hypothetical protein EPO35_12340 [Acidobacteriota bacterium]
MAAVALLLTVVFTWPMAARFGSAGRLDSNDGRFSIWNVTWVARALTSEPSQLWNANIFYPSQGALAFSEANLVAGAIAAPVWILTGNPYAATNFVILCSFVLSAVCMYALVLHLTGRRPAAALAAVLFGFNSYVFAHLPHIQLLLTFGPVLALLTMHRFVERPALGRAVVLGLAVGVQALACGYYGVFGGLGVVAGVVWFAATNGHWRRPRYWLLAAAAAAVSLMVIGPLLPSYLALRDAGLDRTLQEAQQYSVRWRSYFASGFLVYRWILPLLGSWREVLFPGFLSIAFTTIAIAHTVRRRDDALVRSRRSQLWFYAGLTVLAIWASLGPDAGLYRFLYNVVPGMSFLRAPSRFGLVVILSMAVMAGFGLSFIERYWHGRRRLVYMTVLALLALSRSTVGPLELRAAPAASKVYAELRERPRGVVAEFPFFIGARLPRQTEYMLASTEHWQPMINGFSDFLPADIQEDMPSLDHFPEPESLRILSRRGVRYVVVHWSKYGEGRDALRARVEGMPAFQKLVDEEGASLFELISIQAERQ